MIDVNQLKALEPYIEEFLTYQYTPHIIVGGGMATFMYWLMYYHPDVMQTIFRSVSDAFPDSAELEVGI